MNSRITKIMILNEVLPIELVGEIFYKLDINVINEIYGEGVKNMNNCSKNCDYEEYVIYREMAAGLLSEYFYKFYRLEELYDREII